MADYEVGYGKPPKHGQIKKGEVRNPTGKGGRPPVSEELKRLRQEFGDMPIKRMLELAGQLRNGKFVTVNGKPVTVPMRDEVALLEKIQDRLLGKSVQPIDLEGEVNLNPFPDFNPDLLDEDELELLAKLIAKGCGGGDITSD